MKKMADNLNYISDNEELEWLANIDPSLLDKSNVEKWLDDSEMSSFIEENKNSNTTKMQTDLNVWTQWCNSIIGRRPMEDIPPKELNSPLAHFFSSKAENLTEKSSSQELQLCFNQVSTPIYDNTERITTSFKIRSLKVSARRWSQNESN